MNLFNLPATFVGAVEIVTNWISLISKTTEDLVP
jgi:hypothetical protein